ncbi:N-6 DNA methylase [Candidatus Vecturithrix granuli]|uniref:N-6 DNA methylase n=1 Tax=Vecturithrix granuli TaxID=1499967 RepID=A0A0S6W5J9_VECG1|nr:N-6 DNA methylase [Candidatus Vecturithrix granuli]
MTADGFSLDDKRTPTDVNDIPDLLAKWPERAAGGNAYRVPIAAILADASVSLSAGRYKPMQTEAVEHDAPQDILAEVLTYEQEIIQKTQALLAALNL